MRAPEAQERSRNRATGMHGGASHADLASLPLPLRARVLRELADDAEGLFVELRRRGWSEDAAAKRVRDVLLPDAAAAAQLRMLHRRLHQRIADRFGGGRMARWERSALAVVAGVTLLLSARELGGTPLLQERSLFLLPVVAVGVAGLLFAAGKGIDLLLGDVRSCDGLREGLAPLLVVAAGTLVSSAIGVLVDLYRLAAAMEAQHDPSGRAVLAFVRADGVLFAVGLMLALAIGLAWFLLLQRVVALERAARDSEDVARRVHAFALGIPHPLEASRPLDRRTWP